MGHRTVYREKLEYPTNPWFQKHIDAELAYSAGLSRRAVTARVINEFKAYPDKPITCGHCHTPHAWYRPTVGAYMCEACESVRGARPGNSATGKMPEQFWTNPCTVHCRHTQTPWTCGALLTDRMHASLTLLRDTADLLNTGPHASMLRSVISLLAPIPLDGDPRVAATRMIAMVNHLDRHPTMPELLHPLTLTLTAWATALDRREQHTALTLSCQTDDALAALADDALAAGVYGKADEIELKISNVTASWHAAVRTRTATGATTPSPREREAEREIAALRTELTVLNATVQHLYN